ncbi:hypothetical protein HCJ46_16585 [Listeria booriae]|uniref:hypothetical protein n=1 Tax=Listeria booriae TaxID=1552123 RepID=UPI0016291E12|nr:hypothetical protein [Listeria booriae]MBC1920377.1 hypothetical protein [Listeria booriae]MBC2207798.1 hypothetical protein [Listeria booriae]
MDETARKTLFDILTKDIEVLESVDGLREVETRITDALNYDNRVWQDKELSGVKVRVKNRSSRENYQKGMSIIGFSIKYINTSITAIYRSDSRSYQEI